MEPRHEISLPEIIENIGIEQFPLRVRFKGHYKKMESFVCSVAIAIFENIKLYFQIRWAGEGRLQVTLALGPCLKSRDLE